MAYANILFPFIIFITNIGNSYNVFRFDIFLFLSFNKQPKGDLILARKESCIRVVPVARQTCVALATK